MNKSSSVLVVLLKLARMSLRFVILLSLRGGGGGGGESSRSSLEKRLLDIDISSKRFNNLTKEERNTLYHLRDGPAVIIKGADKGCAVVFETERII